MARYGRYSVFLASTCVFLDVDIQFRPESSFSYVTEAREYYQVKHRYTVIVAKMKRNKLSKNTLKIPITFLVLHNTTYEIVMY